MKERIRIGGIKLSGNLTLTVLSESRTNPVLYPGFRLALAENQINMTMLAFFRKEDGVKISFTTASEDAPRVEALAKSFKGLHPEFFHDKTTISIFPAKSGADILGRALWSLGQAGVEIRAISSSLSTLTFVIDLARQDLAVRTLTSVFDIPSYHAPFTPEIQVRQSTIVGKE
ncbi:MAG: hypothetical protein V1816_02230 [Pseudomonadota bacterium]